MKRIFYLTAVSVGISVLFGICYYTSFRNALLHYNREAEEENTELLKQLLEYSGKNEQLLRTMLNEENGMTVSNSPETLCKDTVFILETQYLCSGIQKSEQISLPGFMESITREELILCLKGYTECMPVNEYLNGLLTYELISFSPEKVILRKTYDEEKIEYQFYICSEDNCVIVYYSDLKTVYETSDISLDYLSEETAEQIRNGFYVKDAKTLYSILEGYTS